MFMRVPGTLVLDDSEFLPAYCKMDMDLQPSDVLFIAFVLWLAWEAINGGGGGGKRSRSRVPRGLA